MNHCHIYEVHINAIFMFVITYTATIQILRLHSRVCWSHFKEVQPNWYLSFKTDHKSALETCPAWTDTTKHALHGVVDPQLCQSWKLMPYSQIWYAISLSTDKRICKPILNILEPQPRLYLTKLIWLKSVQGNIMDKNDSLHCIIINL
jgi:hypothetical protein